MESAPTLSSGGCSSGGQTTCPFDFPRRYARLVGRLEEHAVFEQTNKGIAFHFYTKHAEHFACFTSARRELLDERRNFFSERAAIIVPFLLLCALCGPPGLAR